jgi:branched-subunit amino acid ABC-type transport system permease component
MVTKFATTRPAPWLHAAAVGAYVSLVVVVCQEQPHWAWVMAPLGFLWSRFVGWLLLRFLFRRMRSPMIGSIEITQAQLTLHETIHNFVNGLSVLQGQVDVMIMRAGRLKSVIDQLGVPNGG